MERIEEEEEETKLKRSLFMILCILLQKCQRELHEDNDTGATGKKGAVAGMGSTKWKSFCHFATVALERRGKGGNDRGGKLLGSTGHQSLGKQA